MPSKDDADRVEVTAYILAWNPETHQGQIRLHLAKQGNRELLIEDPAELAALAAVLSEAPVYLEGDGTLTSGWEPVHDGD